MARRGNIITVGIRPAWDVLCKIDGLEWGDHKTIDQQHAVPAGKALNVSRALAWMGYPSVAMGLWGQEDYDEMFEQLRPVNCFVDIRFTAVRGHTRRNITIHDTLNNRQMHLRLPGSLANKGSLKRLTGQIENVVSDNDIVVFAGSMPEASLTQEVLNIIRVCHQKNAKVFLDSSGAPFKRIVENQCVDVIFPNMLELGELVGNRIKDDEYVIAKEARKLLDKVEAVVVSRAAEGVVLVTRAGSWVGKCSCERKEVVHTVGCGDNLLAGFLAGLYEDGEYHLAIEKAIKLATAHTFGLNHDLEWWEAEELLEAVVEQI